MNRKQLLTLSFILCAITAQADILKGRVVDADTGEPLPEAEVVFNETSIDMGSVIHSTIRTDSVGQFIFSCRMELSRLTITASYFGYHSQSVQRMGNNDRDTVTIDDFRLKMDEHLLGEVTVEGRARRFYMRGDTVVFNPEAFKTQDGARLIELIEQLPGVSVNDGKLLWNGEPLKLMMNGQQAFNEAMLTNLLPVEAVKDIKAYDKKSDFEQQTGVADGKEQHVLDVTIKPGFMDKLYGDAELKGLTSKNYAAHLRAMRLSDTDPLMLYGRVADDPTKMNAMTINGYSSHGSNTPIRQQTGAVGYSHLWKPTFNATRPSYWSINGGANHTDQRRDSWENQQNFLPGTTATETDQTRSNYQHNLKIPVDFSSFLNLTANTKLNIDANITYHRGRTTTENNQQTFDLANPDTKTNSSTYHALSTEEGFSTNVRGNLSSQLGKTELGASASLTYDNMQSDGESTGIYQYTQGGTTQTDRQHYHAPNRHLTADARLQARRAIGNSLAFMASWQTTYSNSFRDEQRHRADTLDLANSLRRDDNSLRNTLYMEANVTQGKFSVKPMLDLTHWHERSDYRRGSLDTLARRNTLLAMPTLELTYRLQKQTRLNSRVAYTSFRPDLIDCIGYVDDTNPLYVTMGNPNLKTSHTLSASLNFSTMLTHASQMLNVSIDFRKNYDPIGTILHYNSETGSYLAQKQNIRGGERYGASINYERDLGGGFHIRNSISESYGQSYGIMTLVDDATGITYNRQRSSDLSDRLNLQYTHGPFFLFLGQNFDWHHYTYSDQAQPRQNIYNYRAAFTFRYTLKDWEFMFIPDFFLDRGYMSDAMNTNRFLLNARVSYKFLKNKASLILYAQDLLDRSTNNYSDVTATSRTEGGSSFLHHYVSLTFNYKFDAKK
ncbi:MAG: outer membrane beta-barrel protein [Prevotella sp.]|nr:outer membrane beta-barrel protein [Prevotella sp.]